MKKGGSLKKQGFVFEPLHENLLVRKSKVEDESKVSPGGILLPASAKGKPPTTAEVIAVSSCVSEILSVGDTVVLGDWSGTPVSWDEDDSLAVVEYKDVLGLLKKSINRKSR